MGAKRRARSGALALAIVAAAAVVLGVAGSSGRSASMAYPFPRTVATSKLDSRLVDVSRAASAHGSSAALAVARSEAISTRGGSVRVVVAAHPGAALAAVAAVRGAGGAVEGTAGSLTEALVPPEALQVLAQNAAVAEVRPPYPFKAQAVDEAVHLSDADLWHTAGNTGAGVKVAVIDLGFSGYSSLLGSALPASVTAIDHCGGNITASPASGGTNHGTAVAELVHQMAPGAQLYLICIDSEVGLAQAEQDVLNDGIKIVNHSVAWFNTSRGDGSGAAGTPDAIVADAQAHGVLWVNAAGNYGEDHWSGSIPAGQTLATFSGGGFTDNFDRVTIQSGETACAFLKWDAWPTTTEDYDLRT